METVLQVALDMENLKRAVQIANEAVKGGADWVEAGTPLIKSEGMDAVRELRRAFPKKVIVADMKTVDVGRFETEMAAKSGADVICVLGTADDDTIKESVKAGRQYGIKIMVDLFGVSDKVKRAKEVEKIGVDYVCVHTSIDEQMRGKIVFDSLKNISKAASIPVAVAGGINSENVLSALKSGADIVIVGGAITKEKNVTNAARRIKKAIKEKKVVKSKIKKYTEKDLCKVFSKVSTPNISDAMHRKGAMTNIRPLKKGYKMVGTALTVKTMDGDWAKTVEAIEKAKEGDVIVIDANGGKIAVWGELASWSCKMKKISGVVIDGAVRDIDDIVKMDFPVFAKNIAPNAGEPKGYGEIGIEIVCGGQNVRNDDWIIGDDSGVVVVPKESAVEIGNRALDVMEKENRIREEIKRGSVLSVVMELEKWEKA
jgi:3-hexulose-6-phosphate synthase/6-phospho-3-hexuloisomerase